MLTRVIVNGSKGKMGSLACETLQNHKEFELVAQLGKEDDLAQAITDTKAQIVVDLTRADCVYQNSLTIIDHGAHPVIGTSGLLPNQIKELTALCESRRLGGIIVPNFSISAVLMMLFAAKAAEYLPEVEIIEAHHQQKLDAPSGTALKTAEMIAAARKDPKNKLNLKELIPGARGGEHCEVNIHSLRLPGIIARQQVIFGSEGETLTITDDCIDRRSFMPGIILSCKKVTGLSTLIYGLEHLL
ncbi:4-hydroxy-tetrahydrodipicolinate reductase [Legionella anisa]|uniref:4-hydroxy-tetrahydrodipicolinate reductase n=1 Tax=Legionella anisa TaxID=28082 RepID=A0AAX0WMW0_9GAMM|nr:4-hydroxy-tetrahydrodipicolinate reductase [Legionella anisa]AWN73018.1 4-hydroxy-tetrahydrodipicolinate reductase [Legionella anisa]KTC73957.1 dihydrodipicolinate reductase [Legionella anisa]MBN5935031.1 4-hydroxy-tetrahydrodipicolinate reductase [Legionella anisa]MCW8423837.1 4-hydroxy-tetrahydrodipicolinate reductase [Legionella anisa]MCW8447357.1 4-hydroxy-tetrahydrodipicolinate reductase [Legionella anisa]